MMVGCILDATRKLTFKPSYKETHQEIPQNQSICESKQFKRSPAKIDCKLAHDGDQEQDNPQIELKDINLE